MVTISPIEVSGRKYIPVDVDVSPLDNSGSLKEGVSYTYKGHVGFAPIFSYVGIEGYMLGTELRERKQHCQKNSPEYLLKNMEIIKKLHLDHPVLFRLDSGNDAASTIKVLSESGHFFLINLTKQFHSELKSDMGIERLPSGKFAVNSVILHIAMIAFNALRFIGQTSLTFTEDLPYEHKVIRKHLRKVTSDLIRVGCKIVHHAHIWWIKLWDHDPCLPVFSRLYDTFCIYIRFLPASFSKFKCTILFTKQ